MTDSTSKVSARRLRPQTELVRGGLMRSGFDETSEAMFLNSGYVYASAEEAEQAFNGERERYVYSRYANPTLSMFEERMRLLEGAEVCRGTASGMAAVSAALLSQVKAGDRVVGAKALFGSCLYILNELLPRYGVETEVVDGTDLKAWEAALCKGAKAVLVETPSNPALDIIDLKAVCDMAHAAGALVIVDNVFATPMLQKPLEYGADIVVYSTTKHIDGQGRCMGGAILCSKEFDADHLKDFYRHTGPSMSPFNAWTMLKGLETLGLRVDRMSDNALALAMHLETLPGLRKVIYPGLKSHPQHKLAMAQMSGKGSTLIGLELEGGKDAAFKVLNRLRVADISNNLGDAKTLITHPSSTTHQRLSEEERLAVGITQSFLRISVGLEDVEDLKEDLEQAIRG
nr:O-succinylhomoserine sulfhydrylase [Kiloniella laminariae]